jgi:hypothetical protein
MEKAKFTAPYTLYYDYEISVGDTITYMRDGYGREGTITNIFDRGNQVVVDDKIAISSLDIRSINKKSLEQLRVTVESPNDIRRGNPFKSGGRTIV